MRWSPEEVAILRALAPQGSAAVAAAVGRPLLSVRQAANRRGISLGRPRKPSPPRAERPRTEPRPWTSKEIAQLRKLAPLGARAVAEALGRPVGSVRAQAYGQHISLRRSGERRARIMGQPRSASFVQDPRLRELRAQDLELPGRRRRNGPSYGRNLGEDLALQRDAPLCPACGARPQETREGWCRVCGLKQIVEVYERRTQAMVASDDHAAARQRRHRLVEALRPREPAETTEPALLAEWALGHLAQLRPAAKTAQSEGHLSAAEELVRRLAWGPDD
jgi:hypothetical protein